MKIENNQILKAAIRQEIAALEVRIQQLAQHPQVAKYLGLDSSCPLIIEFGTDTELRIAEGDNVPFGRKRINPLQAEYQLAVLKATKGEDLPKKPDHGNNDRLEINPAPATPLPFIDRVERVFLACKATAYEMGLSYQERGFHLHTTIVVGKRSLLAEIDSSGLRNQTRFAKLLLEQVVEDQKQMPCLFIKPRKAEKQMGECSHLTSRIHRLCDGKDKSVYFSVLDCMYPGNPTSPHFEQRLATMVPYVPVLMMLSAIEHTLMKIDALGNEARPADYIDDVNIHCGKGGYEYFLRKTVEYGQIERRFPNLAPLLYEQIFADYRSYIKRSSRYKGREKAEALAKIDSIEAAMSVESENIALPKQCSRPTPFSIVTQFFNRLSMGVGVFNRS